MVDFFEKEKTKITTLHFFFLINFDFPTRHKVRMSLIRSHRDGLESHYESS